MTLSDLEVDVIACRACPRMVAWREEVGRIKRRAYQDDTYWARPVPGFGDTLARVLVVGLAPGAHGSNRTGRMFTGDASGDFLYPALWRAGYASRPVSNRREDGLTLKDLWITAVCRCVPPQNKPERSEILNCRQWLTEEFALLPNLVGIVALGRIAWDEMVEILGLREASRKTPFAHGSLICAEGQPLWLLGSYHPSRQNTQTGKLTPVMFDQIWRITRDLCGE